MGGLGSSIYPAQAGYFVCGVAMSRVGYEVIETVRAVLDTHAVRGCNVCIALSGGLDSVVLLHAMLVLAPSRGIKLKAIHVDHGLHESASQWAEFCRDICDKQGVPLSVECVTVVRDSGLGTEAAARNARYAAFAKVEADFLALAHHRDDQVETFLLQLLRGAGATGLSAMPVQRSLRDGGPRLLRPLLGVTRLQVASFAVAHKLNWIDDISNAELAYDRNFVRHAVLPVIEKRFPAYRKTFARASRNLAEAAELASILGQRDLAEVRTGEGVQLNKMRSWPEARALNLLRIWIRELGYQAPRRSRLSEALRQAFEARQDAGVQVDFGSFSLRRYRDCLFVVGQIRFPEDWRAVWRGESEMMLPQGLGRLLFRRSSGSGISVKALQGQEVSVAFRAGGECLALAANRPHRELRKLFQEAGVAPWQRDCTPLVFCGRRLAFVPGLGVGAEWQAGSGEESWEIDWVEGSVVELSDRG